jgi:hypothetical protein
MAKTMSNPRLAWPVDCGSSVSIPDQRSMRTEIKANESLEKRNHSARRIRET